MQYIDLFTWLRGDILVKADRMSMAHSLELRVPFLDRAVFDVAARIPVELKVPPKSDTTKYALRRAVEGIVPPAHRGPAASSASRCRSGSGCAPRCTSGRTTF